MSVILSQANAAAFVDRQGGGSGLAVALSPGNDGAYVVHDLGADESLLHMRVMLGLDATGGGLVRIAGGQDAAGEGVWWLDLDLDTGGLTAGLATGQTIAATLALALLWHCVELKVDAAGGAAELWINGISAGSVAGTLSSLSTRRTWLGGILKDTAATGTLYLDEWVLADAYVGPVVVTPSSAYGDDRSRWLVVYNTAVSDSAAWVEYYRVSRNVPFANLAGLSLSTAEVIDTTAYAALATAVDDYLSRNALSGQVLGVLLGYGVPGYVNSGYYGGIDAVAALMHVDTTAASSSWNPLAVNAAPTRPTMTNMSGLRLTARLDAANLTDAKALVDRATALVGTGTVDAGATTLWLDPFAGYEAWTVGQTQWMIEWGQSVERMRLRLPIEWSAAADSGYPDVDFPAISSDGFFYGWASSASPPAGFYSSPAGTRVLSVQLYPDAAATVRSGSGGNWIEAPLAAGYAAAAAGARIYSVSGMPYPRPLFEALRLGWTLAEAWFVALPLVGEGLYLVGDPLLTVAVPKAGWDVYGPLSEVTALNPEAPIAALREQEMELALDASQQPAEGTRGWYLLRHVDAQGRSDQAVVVGEVGVVNGQAAAAVLAPVWPIHADWATRVEDGQVVAHVLWDRPLRGCAVASVQLTGEVDGAAEAMVFTATVDPAARMIEARVALPTTQGRYRWQATSAGGVVWRSPWSAIVQPRVAGGTAMQILEVSP